MIYIGIDTGTHTGLAVWDSEQRKFLEVHTLKIHQAMEVVVWYKELSKGNLKVIFEDARQRTWFGERSNAKLQGAGSVKRDSSIWEDFLKDWDIEFWAKPPQKGATKLSDKTFKAITKFEGKTSEHARDACMLVYGC